ncbi:MAG: hypothetical protein KDC46_01495 [Thermoleophilia bacterium]|nr:hypothetical protein [Thermoleophilia bacterium]
MRLALVVLVAAIGVAVTVLAAARMWRASRSGAPREQVLGYVALMVGASVVTTLLLRAL